MTLRIRQIVLAARDLEAAVRSLTGALGVQVCYCDPNVAEFGLRNALMPIGDQFLEVVSPIKDGTAAGRLIERRGESGYMVIFQTDNLDRDRARFERLGVRIVWSAAYEDVRAVHLHPKDVGGAIVSVDQPTPPGSWRWAGPDWQEFVAKSGAQRVVGVEIEALEPEAMARRWAEVLGLDPPTKKKSWRIPLAEAVLDFIQAGPRGEGVGGFTLGMSECESALEAARAVGLPVAGDVVTVCGTRFRLTDIG